MLVAYVKLISYSSLVQDKLYISINNYRNSGYYHRLVLCLQYVSETVFCLRLQVEPTHLQPIERASLSPEIGTSSIS
jgi:hypothetical protein